MAMGLRWCVLVNVVFVGTAADAILEAKLAELEKLYLQNHDKINTLEGEIKARRLSKSIYGASTSRNTVAYSADENTQGALTCMWLIICAALVMFMQAGFAVREMGFGRRKFAHNILLKNLVAVSISVWAMYFFGWSFAWTGPWKDIRGTRYRRNHWIGYKSFAAHGFIVDTKIDGNFEPTMTPLYWFFHWAMSAVAATIACSGPADRLKPVGYIVFTVLFTGIIYPIIVAWTWGRGWLAEPDLVSRTGFYDMAGSGIVHLSGGSAALFGAILAGPREGRFRAKGQELQPGERDPCQPHSLPLAVLGTFILWFGWYGLNCGCNSMPDIKYYSIEHGFTAAQIAMNTTIAASGAGLTAFILQFGILKGKYDVGSFCGGVLAGLVSISSCAKSVECGSAVAIGVVGAIFYILNSTGLRLAKIDDPVDAWAIHGACGIWGCLAAPLFDWGKGMNYVHGWYGFRCWIAQATGTCAQDGDSLWKSVMFGNLCEIGAILGWSGGLAVVVFLPLKIAKQLSNDATPHELNAYTDYEGQENDYNPTFDSFGGANKPAAGSKNKSSNAI